MSEYINAFPGYEHKWVDGITDKKQNMYRGVNLGFGGYVYYEEGIYTDVALLDIQSLHPHSIISMNKFGKYTQRYEEILKARIAIKNHDYETAGQMLGGAFKKFLTSDEEADKLANATKLILNSTYGFCSATFENPFLDSRDTNNIVALKGALFMKTLQDEVQKRGFTVAHIKTDSIKVPNATREIVQFIKDFAKPYGYDFDFEGIYDRMCLVNGSTYIAKYASPERCQELHGLVPKENRKHPNGEWTATAKQFQVPYVFKTLFSKEPIEFKDLCETKEVKTAMYLDMNEGLPNGEHDYHFIGKVGNFCPVKPGCGGGVLVKESKKVDSDGNMKYDSVTGTLKPDKTPYRWFEAEAAKALGKENDVDKSYYRKLVDDAIDAISQYGDFERFVADEPYITIDPAELEFPLDDESDLPWYSERELRMMAEAKARAEEEDAFNKR